MANVAGVGPDAPVVTNEAGAKQSKVEYRLDLMPPLAELAVGEVLAHGAEKYDAWNWLGIPAEDHLNHLRIHLAAFVAGDTQEGDVIEHAKHATCRAMMWLDRLIRDQQEAE